MVRAASSSCRWFWLAGSLCLLLGCVRGRPVRVRSEPFDFAGVRATVRDFGPGAICEAEPRFLLDELSSVNGLLSRFLGQVPGASEEGWSESAITLAEEGGTVLPPLLELHRRSLAGARRCEFGRLGAWPELIARGGALVSEVGARLDSAPGAIKKVRAAQALAAWQQDRLVQQESARRACPRKLSAPFVYFAWRERGVTTWLFCDGAQVTREGQQRAEFEAGPEPLARGARRYGEGAYLSAVGRHPGALVLTPPAEEKALTAW